ncbi:EboA domain-containing protein [Nonomuraea typhae]|uniref:EboA domain-containing protein n=1 Tax=Nonomuraea typhae TaxID=2603600 RepID=UPI0015E1EFB0
MISRDLDPHLPPAARKRLEEAIRTHGTTLITAALGEYGARRLSPPAFRHAVLTRVFTEVPLAQVAGSGERAGREPAPTPANYAAGRPSRTTSGPSSRTSRTSLRSPSCRPPGGTAACASSTHTFP